MKNFEIEYDGKGNPVYVHTVVGGMHESGPYNEKEHGWMLEQLNANDFPAIQAGRDMEALVREVNRLNRENWQLKKRLATLGF